MIVLFHLENGCLQKQYWLSKGYNILLVHINLLKNFRLVVSEINIIFPIEIKRLREVVSKIRRWSEIHNFVRITVWTNLLYSILAKISWEEFWPMEIESILMLLSCHRGSSVIRRKLRETPVTLAISE